MSLSINAPIPVTLLTGFLGAGKTTLLNHLLATAGERIVVIENEFGPVNIDSDLLIQETAELVEMTNGCLCCTIRGDLSRHLHSLYERKQSGELAFERVVIETTGLADPTPIAQTFFGDPLLADAYALDAVITVVDALHGAKQLDEQPVAGKQVGFADRLLISKADLADAEALDALAERLAGINSEAAQYRLEHGRIGRELLFGVRGFHLDEDILRRGKAGPLSFRPAGARSFGDDIAAVHLHHDGPLDLGRISDFMRQLVEHHGDALLRYKGVLAVSAEARRLVFQGVHRINGFDYGREWGQGEAPVSDIVLIGHQLPQEEIRAGFAACVEG
ncbi:CobW family GTP-binding protein [Crenobacter cavernae]|uniref:GTP-binding protein n=1 Tax=Crenobacter cavernae TaxID=2290923 RepID=A0A345Y8B5_9NEIS|nr:GTP-binding protein [Crenobacter cavernae]AXK40167.1 GTP-binding protein [Crenobacter cavernae]